MVPERVVRATTLGALLLLSVAGGSESRSAFSAEELPPANSESATACARCNIVLVVLDAARADHASLYGYRRPTTPNLERIAKDSIVFDQAYSEASYTVPSLASLFTGLPPAVHGVHTFATPLAARFETLAETLHAQGYRTAGFTENPLVTEDHGFAQGFDEYSMVGAEIGSGAEKDYTAGDSRAHIRDALAWASRDRAPKHPFFLYVHLLRPHSPYWALPEHAGRFSTSEGASVGGGSPELAAFQFGKAMPSENDLAHLMALYDENFLSADALVGSLVDGLENASLLDRTVVVIVGDHGEEFAEHGKLLHGVHVFEESIHVPLLIRFPETMKLGGKRVEAPVQLADVAPTLLGALNVPVSSPLDVAGTNLLPHLVDASLEARPVVSQANPLFGAKLYRARKLKLIETAPPGPVPPELALYDLDTDPGERVDLAASHTETVRAMREDLHELLKRRIGVAREATREVPLSEDRLKKLRSLGYVE